ncbi:hypothetical protein, partial [Rubrivirga sp.]|uniref:dioxygenase family protein n=1 Tax=Rubrivirga sp. TaxID=1885344 RepID=UPI003C74C948
MHDDDVPIGRLLSRREALAVLSTGSAALLLGCGPNAVDSTPGTAASSPESGISCVVKPEETEGPFFGSSNLNRADLRLATSSGVASAGVPLAHTVGVSSVGRAACTPLEGAIVNVWQCDARGAYSGFRSEGTEGADFLRGFQRTDASGQASFLTVYPGWYRGRAVHVHLKVRTSDDDDAYEFTSQLYFPDAVSAGVFAQPAYARSDTQRVTNTREGV